MARRRRPESWELFDRANDYAELPPHNGTPTSEAAANRKRSDQADSRRKVLQCVLDAPDGTTRDAIAVSLGWQTSQVNPRVWELRKAGAIVQTTERRPTRAGCSAAVLRPAPA
jgi:hypothetical protein